MRSIKLPSWSKKLLGLDPVPVPGHVFSVSREHVRYGFFNRENGELAFNEFHSEELGGGAFHDGPLGGTVRDIDRFTQTFGALIERISMTPEEASLVVPDQWLRIAFTDIEEIPRGNDRDAILRFKLKRLVPFRVEDLRLNAVEVSPLDASGRHRRLLLGFGLETLMAQLEATLGQHGVNVGYVSNEGLSLLPALAPVLGGGLSGVVHVTSSSYTLIVTEGTQPVLHRFKTLGPDDETRARLVPRDLLLTRDYLRQEIKGRRLGELILVASEEEQASWQGWLEEAFAVPVRSFGVQWPELPGTVTGMPSWQAAPLLGAASRGVY